MSNLWLNIRIGKYHLKLATLTGGALDLDSTMVLGKILKCIGFHCGENKGGD